MGTANTDRLLRLSEVQSPYRAWALFHLSQDARRVPSLSR